MKFIEVLWHKVILNKISTYKNKPCNISESILLGCAFFRASNYKRNFRNEAITIFKSINYIDIDQETYKKETQEMYEVMSIYAGGIVKTEILAHSKLVSLLLIIAK